MGRFVTAVGVASIALVACNMLTGVDGLSSTDLQTQAAAKTSDSGPAAPEVKREHEAPMMTGSSGSSGQTDDGGLDAASEAASSLPTFTDDFNRPNGSAVGNGWLEKTPGKFPIVNGAAQQSTTGIYRNLFVSRPAAEDALDVLVSATVTFGGNTADPCLFARVQESASQQKDHFIGYSLYPDGPADLYISRDDGTAFRDVGSASISPALVVGQAYHLSLQVTGTNPVHLVGSLTRADGTVVAAITTNDADGKRVATAGSVGFGSSAAQGSRWDDFRRVTLPATP